MGWTDERVELLKKLWTEGYSATQVAKQLKGVTRNAVLGKLGRLGLLSRPRASAPPASRPKSPAAPKPPRPAPPAPKPPAPALVVDRGPPDPVPAPRGPPRTQPVEWPAPGQCRWPFGDPQDENFRFCVEPAQRSLDGAPLPWCPRHMRLGHQPGKANAPADPRALERALRRWL